MELISKKVGKEDVCGYDDEIISSHKDDHEIVQDRNVKQTEGREWTYFLIPVRKERRKLRKIDNYCIPSK